MADEKIKHIIRVANTDLKGHKAVIIAMTKIKGIGIMFANVVCKKANVSITKKAGLLNENEVKNLTDVIENPSKYKIPIWMYNRRRDYDTGEDTHLITSDLHFTQQQDVRRLQKIKSNNKIEDYINIIPKIRSQFHWEKRLLAIQQILISN